MLLSKRREKEGMKEKGGGAGEGTSKLVKQPAAVGLVSARKIKHCCMSEPDIRNVSCLDESG